MTTSPHAQWEKYEAFVNAFPKLKWFVPDEFLYLGSSHNDPTSRCHGLNWYPEENLWQGMHELGRHLDRVRDSFGAAVMLNSVYRNEAYNNCIGGARNSYHKAGIAGDCMPLNGDVTGLWQVADELTPNGGVGRYTSFVHVDVRGYKARW